MKDLTADLALAAPAAAPARRDPAWRPSLYALLAVVLVAFAPAVWELVNLWATKADYSHGFLVPVFAGYLLWLRRDRFPQSFAWPDPAGLLPIAVGVLLYVLAGWTNKAKEMGQGLGLVLALTGVVWMMCGGWKGLRWAWPGLVFLLFMLKLPDRIEIQFMFKLRQVATEGSNFLLQTLGYPAYIAGDGGTVIHVGDVRLGVEWACAGLSMVLTFVAMAAAIVLLSNRPWPDKLAVLLSSLPIAVVSNVLRITLTGLIYIAGWKSLGDLIVHDLAGWLMMPLALGFLWAELKLIDWLFVRPEAVDRDGVLHQVSQTASTDWVVRSRRPGDPAVPQPPVAEVVHPPGGVGPPGPLPPWLDPAKQKPRRSGR